MNIRKLKTYAWLLPALMLMACQQDERLGTEPPADARDALQFDMRDVSADLLANAQVYVFDGQGTAQGQFNHKVLNLNRAGSLLSMNIPQGKWDLMLVSADPIVMERLVAPVRGTGRAALKMWENTDVDPVGYLNPIPEIRTARIDEQIIAADQQHAASATLARHAAMIKVVVKEVAGVKGGFASHACYLKEVPNALNWAGSLYPDKDRPQVSPVPMRSPLVLTDNPATGYLHSDTMTFIVPAHVGRDYLSSTPVDTSTHRLTVALKLEQTDGIQIDREVVIPIVPKANKIMVVSLTVKAQISAEVTVTDWVDKQVSADLSNTSLQVSKTNLALSYKDTLFVKGNRGSVSVTPGAGWITTRMIDAEQLEVTANVNDYTVPRSSFIDLKTGNLTKKIAVNQRPDRGTIKLSPSRVILSPVHPSRNDVFVDCRNEWTWQLLPSDKVTPSPSAGSGKKSVTLTRKDSENDLSAYGNEFYTVRNTHTLDTSRIELCNLFIDAPDEIFVGNPVVAMDTTVYNDEIMALGASEKFTVVSTPDWMTAVVEPDGRFKIQAQRDPDEEGRTGAMVLAHADDPDYQITVNVVQDVIVRIPEFDYFTLKFTWRNNDVDIVVELADNGAVFDKRPVGYSKGSTITYDGYTLLQWGGDATQGQGETAFLNAPVVNSDNTLRRKLNMDIYATWFTSGRAPDTMSFAMYAYKGGTMIKDGTNFNNVGGILVYSERYTVMITTTQGSGTYATGGYTPVARLIYDRIKHSARVELKATPANEAVIPPRLPQSLVSDKPKPYMKPKVIQVYSR